MYKKSFRQTVEVAVSVSPSLCAVKAASTQKLKKPTPYQIFLRISRRAVLFQIISSLDPQAITHLML